jgi:hypothetical protein
VKREKHDEAARASGWAGVTAWSRLPAERVAMAAAGVWLFLFGVLHLTTDVMVVSLFSVAPLIVATVADERRTAAFAGAAVALAVAASPAILLLGPLADSLFGNGQPALLEAGLFLLDATQLRTQLDQLLVVAGLRGESG